MTEKEQFEVIKDTFLSIGGKIFLEDVIKNKEASDTVMVMPLIQEFNDPVTGKPVGSTLVSSQSDEMLKRQGYVQALNWVIGSIGHYQTAQFGEDVNDEL